MQAGLHPSSTQPQPSQPVQNTICGSTHYCSPDDGHNDARNMLRYFDNKHQISCILLVSLSSPYVHDARSQETKKISKCLRALNTEFIFGRLRDSCKKKTRFYYPKQSSPIGRCNGGHVCHSRVSVLQLAKH